MSTERFDANNKTVRADQQIVSSSGNEQTVRTDQTIIGSGNNNEHTVRSTDQQIIQSETGNSGYTSIPLNGKVYNVIRLIASSGEAEVLEVEENGHRLVLKYYFSNFKPKDSILHTLQQIRRNDLIVPLDYGYYQNRFLEVNEYMAGGTLEDIFPLRDPNRIKDLVGRIMEALHACHQHNIIHRDIKPVNIFFRNAERREIVLGDFGISSSLQEGDNYKITTAARTRIYAAPELEMGTNANNQIIVDSKVDFYALGICLLEMWVGDNPFKGVDHFVIPRLKLEGRIAIPKDIDRDLEKLIKGLITTEPPKRWGYDEVRKWLNGEPVNVHFQVKDFKYDDYPFDPQNGIVVNDPKDIAYHMEHDPIRGTRQLYSGEIKNWIGRTSPDLAADLYDIIEKEYKQENEAGLIKAIYLLDPYKPFKSFDGTLWNNQAELGVHIEQHATHYKAALRPRTAPLYLFLEARGEKERANKYRKYYIEQPEDRAFNLVILDLQENKLSYEGMVLENTKQLTEVADHTQQKLLQDISDPNSKVSVWLDITYPQLYTNLQTLREHNRKNTTELRYALQTAGYRDAGREVFTPEEFYLLLKEKPEAFTVGAHAATVISEADYWLSCYQGSPLMNMVLDRYLVEESCQFEHLKGFFAYFLDKHPDTFTLVKLMAPAIKKNVGDNSQQLQELVSMAHPYGVRFYNSMRTDKELAGHTFDKYIFIPLRDTDTLHHVLAEKVMLSFNGIITEACNGDLAGLANYRNEFEDYYEGMVKFFDENIAPIAPTLPFYQHILAEQSLIRKKTKQYLAAALEEQVNYLEKGKRYYRTFLWIGAVINYVFQMSVSMSTSYTGMPLYYGLGGFVIVFFLTRYIRKRPADTGIGTIADPLYRSLAKWMYQPILEAILAQENHPMNQQATLSLEQDPHKSLKVYNEKVRIVLLEPHVLETELKKQ